MKIMLVLKLNNTKPFLHTFQVVSRKNSNFFFIQAVQAPGYYMKYTRFDDRT